MAEDRTWGIISLVMSIFGLIFLIVPFMGIVFSILGVVFSRKKEDDSGFSKAGLIIGIIGIITNLVFIAIFLLGLLFLGNLTIETYGGDHTYDSREAVAIEYSQDGVVKERILINKTPEIIQSVKSPSLQNTN